jgi:hypothetical protein
MATVAVILVIIVLIGLKIAYGSFKMHGFRPRNVQTSLSPDQLRHIFRETVATTGWFVVDEGNPMVAQSPLLAGIRQQIALRVGENNGRTAARIEVIRYSKKVFGGATKAYTLRWRMNAFLSQVQRADTSSLVAG